ncbi:MAG: hypothetical protein PHS93_07845 [Candidatus Omnitrophica bacterium]|nr:hypothetical protein [Candidatus Omnitrophota bacterium]
MRIKIISAVNCPKDKQLIEFRTCQECLYNSGHLLGYDVSLCAYSSDEEQVKPSRPLMLCEEA